MFKSLNIFQSNLRLSVPESFNKLHLIIRNAEASLVEIESRHRHYKRMLQWRRKQFASGWHNTAEIFLMCPFTFHLCSPHEGHNDCLFQGQIEYLKGVLGTKLL